MKALAVLLIICGVAHADPDPKRKVIVLEYRASSSALPGIANQIVTTLSKQTSLELLGPDQTRATFGDHLEQVISKCVGEADCIAKIGAKVGASEVILVGISELGDVILTMQRIDVQAHVVRARVADSLANGVTPDEDQIAYYLAKILPPGDFMRFGVIDIISSQAGALVTVGGEKRGATPIKPLKLHAPATYTVRVEKDGFTPFTTKIALPPDGMLQVNANLSKKGGGTAWYAHWYVLTIGSILVAGVAGGGIYYATRPPPATSVPVGGMYN
jgi:PEGA domain